MISTRLIRGSRTTRLLFAGLTVLAVGGAVYAVTGVVQEPDGELVKDAKVCYHQYGVEQICVLTDEAGKFELPDNEEMPIRIVADGHHVETRPAVGHHEIVLRPSPTLVVRLVDDATGKTLENGELQVVYSAQKKVGPFPVGAAGVVIQRVLKPGQVRLVGRADGYRRNDTQTLELENGKKTEVEIRLEQLPAEERR